MNCPTGPAHLLYFCSLVPAMSDKFGKEMTKMVDNKKQKSRKMMIENMNIIINVRKRCKGQML